MNTLVLGNCYCNQLMRGQFDDRIVTIDGRKFYIREVKVGQNDLALKHCNLFLDSHYDHGIYQTSLDLRAVARTADSVQDRIIDYTWEYLNYRIHDGVAWRFLHRHTWERKKPVAPETVLKRIVFLLNEVPETWRTKLLSSIEI